MYQLRKLFPAIYAIFYHGNCVCVKKTQIVNHKSDFYHKKSKYGKTQGKIKLRKVNDLTNKNLLFQRILILIEEEIELLPHTLKQKVAADPLLHTVLTG